MHKLEFNPILVREFRARWRGWGAFGLLFGYVALMAVGMGWCYIEAYDPTGAQRDPLQRMAALGHQLFLTITWMQALAWMLIAPALTATSIAGERESGLLESVQLSPLAPARILFGKLFSALSFIALLILVSLPITAICFLMGGVSPEEFNQALLMHAVTAVTCAIIGLACSAWSRRANIALRSSFVLVIGWGLGSAIALWAALITSSFGAPFTSANWWLIQFGFFFGLTNPIIAAISIAEPSIGNIFLSPTATLFFFDAPVWVISMAFQVLLSLILLWTATRALRRPFGEQYWIGRKTPKFSQREQVADSSLILHPSSFRQWWAIPIVSQLRFANPVMQREVRAKFKMRQAPLWLLVFEVLLGMAVLYYYLRTLWEALFQPYSRDLIWWGLSFIGLFILALASAVMGASTFTREREAKTWEGINLSLLSPHQIIWGKLSAPLLACLVYSIPLWPLLLPCVRRAATYNSNNGIALAQAIATILIITATAWCYTLWGMYCSWRCRRTVTAAGWTLAALFFALVMAPMFLTINSWQSDYAPEKILACYHPFVALGVAMDATSQDANYQHARLRLAAFCVGVLSLAGCTLWLMLYAAMRAHIREKDRQRIIVEA